MDQSEELDQLIAPPRNPGRAPAVIEDAIRDFASGGLYNVMQKRGADLPDWMGNVAGFFNDPNVDTAIGMAGGPRSPKGFKFTPENQGKLQELFARGAPIDEISDALGVTPQQARGVIRSIDPRSSPDLEYWNTQQGKMKQEAKDRADILRSLGKTSGRADVEVGPGFSRQSVAEQLGRDKDPSMNPIAALRSSADFGDENAKQLAKSILDQYMALEKPADKLAFQQRMYGVIQEPASTPKSISAQRPVNRGGDQGLFQRLFNMIKGDQ